MNTFEGCGNAQALAQAITDRLPSDISSTAKALYAVLVEVGVEVERRRGHSPSVVESCFHLPVELVAEVAGVSRVSAWRHLPALVELGVVSHRPHKAMWRGGERVETRNSGSVWRVRLTPLRGSRARVSADDLRHKWRGKEMRGAASKRALKHTKALRDQSIKTQVLVDWAVNPKTYTNPVDKSLVCSKRVETSLEALLDVLKAPYQKARVEAVDLGARALASALSDQTGLNFYRLLLWNLLRRHALSGEDFTYAVYLTALRARVDVREGFARRGGALFTARLKSAPWWSSVMNDPLIQTST